MHFRGSFDYNWVSIIAEWGRLPRNPLRGWVYRGHCDIYVWIFVATLSYQSYVSFCCCWCADVTFQATLHLVETILNAQNKDNTNVFLVVESERIDRPFEEVMRQFSNVTYDFDV